MFVFIQFILTDITSMCITSTTGLVLTKYYRDTCPHCQRITPLLADVHDVLKKNHIDIQVVNVECSQCNCSVANIDAVPTIVLSRDGIELGRFRGYREYDFIADFVSKHSGISKKILYSRKTSMVGQVLTLKASDFYTAFQGPWIFLFYEDVNDVKRQLIKEIADIFSGKIQVGEIHKSDAENIEVRYDIQAYPTILGLYSGAGVEFRGDGLPRMMEFCEKLLEPSLIDINHTEFLVQKESLKNGEPIFMVFYTNNPKVTGYFGEVANDFKFRAKFYKTNDKKIFEMAGIHPKETTESTDNDDIVLVVYRNNIFHKYVADISNASELYDWLFHAHYPHVSLFSEKNYQNLFYGVKPLVILFTHNDELVDTFEHVSRDRHLGLPFASEIFVVIDMKDFSTFAKVFFPNHKTPGVLIYNPMNKKSYSENKAITKENILNETHKMLRLYDAGKLKALESWKFNYKWIFGVVLIGLGAGYFGGLKKHSMKID